MLEEDNKLVKAVNQIHYAQFLLAHSNVLKEFAQNIIAEYYEEEIIIRHVFKEAINSHYESKYYTEYKIGPADVIETKRSLAEGLIRYQRKYK